ncbi:hypothetical protein PIB30_054550 [Stylosanthes scabra]|uniref:Uncharacterized protein n=1 Tax=Stylosanthes scabra TaxID=79078 RepID=A0ABU6RIZ8_9FABA|nr:hypothetical protein [Stylosanthes scabra]
MAMLTGEGGRTAELGLGVAGGGDWSRHRRASRCTRRRVAASTVGFLPAIFLARSTLSLISVLSYALHSVHVYM